MKLDLALQNTTERNITASYVTQTEAHTLLKEAMDEFTQK